MATNLTQPLRKIRDVVFTAAQPQWHSAQPRPGYRPSVFPDTVSFTDGNVSAASVGEIVAPMDGNIQELRRQIISVTSTTATVDKAWPAAPTATALAAYRPAALPVRTTSSGNVGGTTVVSSDHAGDTGEPDDFWNDGAHFLICIKAATSTPMGKAIKITDFDATTGTFTLASAAGAQSIAGELWIVVQLLRYEPDSLNVGVDPRIETRPIAGRISEEKAIIHGHTPSIAFDLPVRHLTAGAGDNVQASAPIDAGPLLRDVMTETKDTGAVASGMSGTTLTVDDGSGFSVGGFVLANTGEAGLIKSKSGAELTIAAGHITAASVLASSVAYAACWYVRKTTSFIERTFYHFGGGSFFQEMAGALPSITLDIARDKVAKLRFSYTVAERVREYNLPRWDSVTPATLLDAAAARGALHSRLLIGGVRVDVESLSVNWKLAPKLREKIGGLNQADGAFMDFDMAAPSPEITFRIYADNDSLASFTDVVDVISSMSTFDFFYQQGQAAGKTFVLAAPACQFAAAKFTNPDQGRYECTVKCLDPQVVDSSLSASLSALAFGYL